MYARKTPLSGAGIVAVTQLCRPVRLCCSSTAVVTTAGASPAYLSLHYIPFPERWRFLGFVNANIVCNSLEIRVSQCVNVPRPNPSGCRCTAVYYSADDVLELVLLYLYSTLFPGDVATRGACCRVTHQAARCAKNVLWPLREQVVTGDVPNQARRLRGNIAAMLDVFVVFACVWCMFLAPDVWRYVQ